MEKVNTTAGGKPGQEFQNNEKILALAVTLMQNRPDADVPSKIARVLEEVCLIYPANKAILDTAPHATAGLDSFDFLKTMKPQTIHNLLKNEAAEKIALASYFLGREDTAKIIAALEPPMIIEIVSAISRLSRRTFISVRHEAVAYATQLQARCTQLRSDSPARIITPPPFRPAMNSAVSPANFAYQANLSDGQWQNLPNHEDIETICILG